MIARFLSESLQTVDKLPDFVEKEFGMRKDIEIGSGRTAKPFHDLVYGGSWNNFSFRHPDGSSALWASCGNFVLVSGMVKTKKQTDMGILVAAPNSEGLLSPTGIYIFGFVGLRNPNEDSSNLTMKTRKKLSTAIKELLKKAARFKDVKSVTDFLRKEEKKDELE